MRFLHQIIDHTDALQYHRIPLWRNTALPDTEKTNLRLIIIPLMISTLAVILTHTMFAVAIPFIRFQYSLDADTASWLIVAYTLPFMGFMPLFGRLADALGRKTLLLSGLVIFLGGSLIIVYAGSFSGIMIGRVIQGIGSACVNPLSMSIIVHHAQNHERGKAFATWNMMGPIAGIAGPLIAGQLIDYATWEAIIWPLSIVVLASIITVYRLIPNEQPVKGRQARTVLASFDWVGVLLFNLMICSLVFFTSSRPITGREPLTDLRLLLAAGIFLTCFIIYERKKSDPFINLSIFRNRNLSCASLSVSVRMMLLGGVLFAIPLLVTDIYGFSASATGLVLVLHSAALLLTMRLGGILIDRWKRRGQIILGLGIESVSMLIFAFMPAGAPVALIFSVVVLHGLGAGLCLAALHIYALSSVDSSNSGAAAGVYSMIRFSGSLFGAAFGGIILYSGMELHGISYEAYVPMFFFYFGISILGAASAFGLTKHLPKLSAKT